MHLFLTFSAALGNMSQLYCTRLHENWRRLGITQVNLVSALALHKRSVLRSLAQIFADKINRGQKSLLVIILGFVRYDIIHKPFGQDDIIHIYGCFEQRSDVPVLKAGNAATYAGD